MGGGMELQSIAAVVIGGTNLFGGEGRVSGTVIGILVIGVLSNGLPILGVAEFWQRVVNGLIIIAVVALDQWRRRAARRGRVKPIDPFTTMLDLAGGAGAGAQAHRAARSPTSTGCSPRRSRRSADGSSTASRDPGAAGRGEPARRRPRCSSRAAWATSTT